MGIIEAQEAVKNTLDDNLPAPRKRLRIQGIQSRLIHLFVLCTGTLDLEARFPFGFSRTDM